MARKGAVDGYRLERWIQRMDPIRRRLTPRECYLATLAGCAQSLRSGTTTALEHIATGPETWDAVVDAYTDAGMRGIVAPQVSDLHYDESDISAAPSGSPEGAEEGARRIVAEVEAFVDRWHDRAGRIAVMVGPSAPTRCSEP